MLPAANRGASINVHVPDVCLSPPPPPIGPIPMVYVDLGPHAMAVGFSPNVLTAGLNAITILAIIPLTMGDQGGVLHWTFMGLSMFVEGNAVVFINLLPAVCLCCLSVGNLFNAPAGGNLVPAATTVFLTYASPGGADRPLTAEDLDALGRELASVGREAGPPVEAWMEGDGVGWIAIRVFSADVPARVYCAMKDLRAGGMRALVLDLRDNPGGEAMAFIELAGDFLPPGSLVATMVDGDGDETVYRSWQEKPYEVEVTIRVNRGTASAAELFVECLAGHGRAKVVGGPTYGKRTGQQVAVGVDGSARAATVARFGAGQTGG
jgi:carboxyl-terminal processing protease